MKCTYFILGVFHTDRVIFVRMYLIAVHLIWFLFFFHESDDFFRRFPVQFSSFADFSAFGMKTYSSKLKFSIKLIRRWNQNQRQVEYVNHLKSRKATTVTQARFAIARKTKWKLQIARCHLALTLCSVYVMKSGSATRLVQSKCRTNRVNTHTHNPLRKIFGANSWSIRSKFSQQGEKKYWNINGKRSISLVVSDRN